MDKLRIRQAIVVEGKYDQNALRQLVDTAIFTTNGFTGMKDPALLHLLRQAAETTGLIILTDSDGAGFLIRNTLKSALPAEGVLHAYIPDIPGKERRKTAPGKEGLVHISKLDTKRVEKVEDVVNVGDEILVKVTEIDSQGRINLSRRDALIALENKKNEENK